MTMAQLYANENFPQPVVEELRRLGHDVLTTADAGQAGQAISDEAVLEFAVRNSRVVVTLNRRHFVKLHGEKPDHFGIIVCSLDPDFVGFAARIDQELSGREAFGGILVRINRPG